MASKTLPSQSVAAEAGADALKALLAHIRDDCNRRCDAATDDADDWCDYKGLTAQVEASLTANLTSASGETKDGFLLALTQLLTASVLSDHPWPLDQWQPLAQTQASDQGHASQ